MANEYQIWTGVSSGDTYSLVRSKVNLNLERSLVRSKIDLDALGIIRSKVNFVPTPAIESRLFIQFVGDTNTGSNYYQIAKFREESGNLFFEKYFGREYIGSNNQHLREAGQRLYAVDNISTDVGNRTINVFDLDGNYLFRICKPLLTTADSLVGLHKIAVDGARIYALCKPTSQIMVQYGYQNVGAKVVVFDINGNYLFAFRDTMRPVLPPTGVSPDRFVKAKAPFEAFNDPAAIGINSSKLVVVDRKDFNDYKFYIYDLNGVYQSEFSVTSYYQIWDIDINDAMIIVIGNEIPAAYKIKSYSFAGAENWSTNIYESMYDISVEGDFVYALKVDYPRICKYKLSDGSYAGWNSIQNNVPSPAAIAVYDKLLPNYAVSKINLNQEKVLIRSKANLVFDVITHVNSVRSKINFSLWFRNTGYSAKSKINSVCDFIVRSKINLGSNFIRSKINFKTAEVVWNVLVDVYELGIPVTNNIVRFTRYEYNLARNIAEYDFLGELGSSTEGIGILGAAVDPVREKIHILGRRYEMPNHLTLIGVFDYFGNFKFEYPVLSDISVGCKDITYLSDRIFFLKGVTLPYPLQIRDGVTDASILMYDDSGGVMFEKAVSDYSPDINTANSLYSDGTHLLLLATTVISPENEALPYGNGYGLTLWILDKNLNVIDSYVLSCPPYTKRGKIMYADGEKIILKCMNIDGYSKKRVIDYDGNFLYNLERPTEISACPKMFMTGDGEYLITQGPMYQYQDFETGEEGTPSYIRFSNKSDGSTFRDIPLQMIRASDKWGDPVYDFDEFQDFYPVAWAKTIVPNYVRSKINLTYAYPDGQQASPSPITDTKTWGGKVQVPKVEIT